MQDEGGPHLSQAKGEHYLFLHSISPRCKVGHQPDSIFSTHYKHHGEIRRQADSIESIRQSAHKKPRLCSNNRSWYRRSEASKGSNDTANLDLAW